MPDQLKNKILLGRITGAHGIRGDVVVRSYTSDPADLASYGPLMDKSGEHRFEIVQLRVTTRGVVVRFNGIADRTKAEVLRGTDLYVERSQLPNPEDGQFYHVDLIGLRAIEKSGADMGTVVDVQDFGGGTLLEILRNGSQQTDLIPFTDTFVPTVDIDAGHVIVVTPNLVDEPEEVVEKNDDAP